MRNARQILDIVLAAFGQQLLDSEANSEAAAHPNDDYRDLARGWQDLASRFEKNSGSSENYAELIPAIMKVSVRFHGKLTVVLMGTQWLRNAQDVLSSMASNYDMSRLFLGQAAAAVALVITIVTMARFANDKAASFVPLSGILLAYGAMMFASSYVEEEHHFWYWATTAWFAYLGVRGFKR